MVSYFVTPVAFTVEPILLAMLIPGLISASDDGLGRVMQSRVISGIGRISYSIYLYQEIAIHPVERLLHRHQS